MPEEIKQINGRKYVLKTFANYCEESFKYLEEVKEERKRKE